MGGLTLNYIIRRVMIFLLTIWVSITIIFLVARLAPGDPISAMVAQASASMGVVENADAIIAGWKEYFGLNDPIHIQYVKFLGNLASFQFGPSLIAFPAQVGELIGRALPWSIGLGLVTLPLIFFIGNFLGALLAWNRTPGGLRAVIPMTMIFTSLPSVLMALIFIFMFAHRMRLFPISGPFGRGLQPGFNLEFISSLIHHGMLPVASLVIVSFGYWALGMRGMMVTTEGEDYMTLAEAKGLPPFYVLYRYQIRNAILPQITALAIALRTLVAGQILVEAIFSYRGIGTLIYTSIRNQDYNAIQGTSFVVILFTAVSVLVIDLIYPLIDPRISLEGN